MSEFVRLGLLNAYRNLHRSLITIVAMAIAGLIMTASLSVQEGYSASTALAYRAFFQGDILIYPEHPVVTVADLGTAGESAWVWHRASSDLMGPLAYFHPELRWLGHAVPSTRPPWAASSVELAALVERIESAEGVSAVRPYWTLPVPTLHFTRGDQTLVVENSVLRSWSVADEHYRPLWEEAMVSGRYFHAGDDGAYVALVDATRGQLHRVGLGARGLPGLGETVTLTLPRPWRDGLGRTHFDYTQTTSVDLVIMGTYALKSNTAVWFIEAMPDDIMMTEELHLTTPEILVPATTFGAILDRLVPGTGPQLAEAMAPAAVSVTVENFAFVERTVAALRQQLPGYAVISTPRQADYAREFLLPEPIWRMPVQQLPRAHQRGWPVDVSPVFSLLLFLVAALIAATNAAILVLERKKEMGILKAVGATHGHVVVMVLTEVLTLSWLGAGLGFAVARIYATAVLLSTATPWQTIIAITLREGGLVLLATSLTAVSFALVPALSTVRLSALEVLRE